LTAFVSARASASDGKVCHSDSPIDGSQRHRTSELPLRLLAALEEFGPIGQADLGDRNERRQLTKLLRKLADAD